MKVYELSLRNISTLGGGDMPSAEAELDLECCPAVPGCSVYGCPYYMN